MVFLWFSYDNPINTLPPVATNPYGVAVAQGPQKQMDAKNNTIKSPAKTKQPSKKSKQTTGNSTS